MCAHRYRKKGIREKEEEDAGDESDRSPVDQSFPKVKFEEQDEDTVHAARRSLVSDSVRVRNSILESAGHAE